MGQSSLGAHYSEPRHAMSQAISIRIALECVRNHLPHHAEEGTLRESIPENVIVADLRNTGIGEEAAELLVAILRRQFDALALLDRTELAQGQWAFVSFPASLLARSLAETWVNGQAILPPDYWEQGDHRPASVKEEQRAILHRMESERLRQNPGAHPVRSVHVAWAVIRMGGRFLLHRREDRERPGEKTHVLPGGRFNPSDLPQAELAKGPVVLRMILDPASPLVDACLDVTLAREIEEELGMRPGEHYRFERWQRLPPYRDLAGTGNRHAYSEYSFQLYTLQFTPAGEVRLLEREAESGTLAWFSIEELAAPRRADGLSAYVDALHAAWGKDIARQLASVPDSAASPLKMNDETQMLDLPGAPDAPWLFGKPGKEKSLSIRLDENEWQLLMLLGWHARGFLVEPDESLRLLGSGWIRLDHEIAENYGRSLLGKVSKHLPLAEMREGVYLRLGIAPDILMLAPSLFAYVIEANDKEGGTLTIAREGISTPWGKLAGDSMSLRINRNTFHILRALESGEDPVGRRDLLATDWERNLRQQLAPEFRRVGLRKLWTTENKVTSLVTGIKPAAGLSALR